MYFFIKCLIINLLLKKKTIKLHNHFICDPTRNNNKKK